MLKPYVFVLVIIALADVVAVGQVTETYNPPTNSLPNSPQPQALTAADRLTAELNARLGAPPGTIIVPQRSMRFGSASTQAIDVASAELRNAATDEAKAAARKKLVTLLAKFFDDDMKNREAELKRVEERVQKLRAQFEKRAGKKQEIVDLQLKVLENEANGLGFFNTTPSPLPNPNPFAAPIGGQDPPHIIHRTPAHAGVIIEAEPSADLVDPNTGEPRDPPTGAALDGPGPSEKSGMGGAK